MDNQSKRLSDLLKKVVLRGKQKDPKSRATQLWLPGFDPDEPVEFQGQPSKCPEACEGADR
ncbi:MAG: hypothetical protein EBT45_07875 [Alphaproteobacteria bacterium]|nr:hypothetical protein [Alphaproteobacteria bacterium]